MKMTVKELQVRLVRYNEEANVIIFTGSSLHLRTIMNRSIRYVPLQDIFISDVGVVIVPERVESGGQPSPYSNRS